jgi:hypothetical protein
MDHLKRIPKTLPDKRYSVLGTVEQRRIGLVVNIDGGFPDISRAAE